MSRRTLPISKSLLVLAAFAAFAAVALLPALAWAQEVAGSNTQGFGQAADKGTFFALATSFGAGVAASLTPCVFPMVPITVAIFGATEAKSRTRGALLSATFVFGIACLFTPLGIAFAVSGRTAATVGACREVGRTARLRVPVLFTLV